MFGLVTNKKLQRTLLAVSDAIAGAGAPGFNNAVYGWLSDNQPIFDQDNQLKYVSTGYQLNGDVFSCVQLILKKLLACPFTLYEIQPGQAQNVKKIQTLWQSPAFESKQKAILTQLKALKEVDGSVDNITPLLQTANEMQTFSDWLENMAGFYLLNGNAYSYMNGPAPGYTTEMFSLPATYMQIVSGGEFTPIKGYRIIGKAYWKADEYTFAKDQVTHIKSFNPNYAGIGTQLYGQSPLRAYGQTLIQNPITRRELTRQQKSGGKIGLVSPKDPKFPLTEPQRTALKASLEIAHGSDSPLARLIPSGAAMDYTAIGLSSVDLQMLESLQFNRVDICNAYNINPILMGNMSASTESNVIEASKQLVYNAVMPLGNKMADMLTRSLCWPVNKRTKKNYIILPDYSALPEMQEDMSKLATWLGQTYWMKGNEKRQAMSLPEDKDPIMDKYLIPTTLRVSDDLLLTDQQITDAAANAGTGY